MAETGSSTHLEIQQSYLPQPLANQILATVYGQCVGDAIGLLTEFLTKEEAQKYYGKKPKDLEYDQKVPDFHRSRWQNGDWTDDTDQMILILQSILSHKGQVVAVDFAKRMKRWMRRGFPELGDFGGMGIGQTTSAVLNHPNFTETPHEVAYTCWDRSQRNIAPNGAVMRTSILGLHQWDNIDTVAQNTLEICKTTHFDPRCQASTVAVSSCLALMLQHTAQHADMPGKLGVLNVDTLIKKSYDIACAVLETDEQKKELWTYMNCKKLKELKLTEPAKIGYTYKCLGSGFWALKQKDFKKAMIKLVMEGGDADTNGSVAGSLLACKLGLSALPQSWVSGLMHRHWLLDFYNRFIRLQSEMSRLLEERTSNDDLSLEALRSAQTEADTKKDAVIKEEIKKKEEEPQLEGV